TTHDMWIAIERLQQGESLNKQDVKTSLYWEFGRFTSRDGESIESYYSRFYKMMNEMVRNQLKVATMQMNVQFLQQLPPEWSRFVIIYQQEVNEIHAEKIAKNANPLALVAAAQQYPDTYYQVPKPYRSYAPPAKTSPSTRSHATTRHKGKESKKPRAVPIRPRKPIRKANQSVATPPNKTVASNSTIQESKSTIGCFMRKLVRHRNGG
ncbi:hypothetical protein Tco_0023374, partial [Tanacetum coccineum]